MEGWNSTDVTTNSPPDSFLNITQEIVLLASVAFLALLVCLLLLVVLSLYRYIRNLRMTSKSNSRLISSFTKSSLKDTEAGTYETVGNSKSTVVQQQPNASTIGGVTKAPVRSECDNGSVPDVKEKSHKEKEARTEEVGKGKDKDIVEKESTKRPEDNSIAIIELQDPDKGTVRYAKINKNKPSVARDSHPSEADADKENIRADIT